MESQGPGVRAGSRSGVRCGGSTERASRPWIPGVHMVSHGSPEVRHVGNGSQREHLMLGRMKLLILQGRAKRAGKEHRSPAPGEIHNNPQILNAAQTELFICSMNVLHSCTAWNHPLYSASRTMWTCRAAPRQNPESRFSADTGVTCTLGTLIVGAVIDTLRSKTEPGDQLKNKSALCWKCKPTSAYCSHGFTACPQGKCVI